MKKAVLCAMAAAAASAAFGQDTIPTYSVTNKLPGDIYDIAEFWQAPASNYGPGEFNGIGGEGIFAAGNSTTTIQDLTKPVPPTGELLMGIYTDPATAGTPAQDHLVLFMDSAAANAVSNIAFGTVFPHTNEDQIISDLKTITNGTNTGQAYNDIFTFVGGDAQHIPSGTSPTGSISAWLTPNAPNVPTPGTIMEWSTGTQIGTFTATNQVTSTTPTPASCLCFAAGIGGIVLRRRKRS